MVPNSEGKYEYSGVLDCMQKSIKREGVKGLWIGYPTYFSWVAPHSIIVLLTQDFLHFRFNPKKSK